LGKGTGLGLSMVYGLVKQFGGHIKAYSEIGAGTVIKLYLPAADSDAEYTARATPEDEELLVGDEVILVVEDDPGVRQTTAGMLRQLGYQVFEAEDGPTALDVLGEHPEIDLLFTDVIMPGGMKGPDLATEARKRRPDVRVLYTSGYTENGVEREGMLLEGASLVSKPFQHSELAYKIRQTLDA
jgi:CheY-like chemotaxis protein